MREEHFALILQYHPELSMEDLRRMAPEQIAPLLRPILDSPEQVELRELKRFATLRRFDLSEDIKRMPAAELWKIVGPRELDDATVELMVRIGLSVMCETGRELKPWAAEMNREFDRTGEFLMPYLYQIYRIVREVYACYWMFNGLQQPSPEESPAH